MLNELRAWCKKVLPLAYSEALSYYEALNKVRKKVNEIIEYVNEIGASAVYRVNGKNPVGGNVDVGTVTSVNNNLPDSNGNVTIETVGGVSSVNNKTGAVTLDASDVGAMPDNYTPPVSSVNNKTGAVNLTASDVGAMPNNYTPPVSSVNNKTGAVTLDADDVGAIENIAAVNGQILTYYNGGWTNSDMENLLNAASASLIEVAHESDVYGGWRIYETPENLFHAVSSSRKTYYYTYDNGNILLFVPTFVNQTNGYAVLQSISNDGGTIKTISLMPFAYEDGYIMAGQLTNTLIPTLPSDLGAMSADAVDDKNVRFVAGVARYENGEWGLLDNSGHTPLNATLASGQTDPGTFTIDHNIGASKVLSLVCGPDEGYAAQGVTSGASVGLTYSVVNVRFPKMAASVIGYNGSAYTHAGVASISSEDIVSSVSMGTHATLGNYLKVNLTKAYPGLINVFSSNQYEWKVLGYGLDYINIQPYLNGVKQNLPLASGAVSLTVAKQTTGVPSTIDHTGCNIWFIGIFEV